ncbi:MAG: flavodoxin family protein [Candidatus Improbicoccus pseudotrichonymphae]|uniref:Flavodoxin family protein n=1 Tax=Candidatus Improbicoccus pseudotrichonymphae TaxID=3033792 RepID=A0AA48IH23_9FIRM|nr:MAG: flavodoxin family protein [Candidatus Improbicoccus pseudotrichonymphae]
MDKIVLFNSSPHRNGFTSRLALDFLGNHRENVEFVCLYGAKISPCVGCTYCKINNKCFIEDDMQKFYFYLENCPVLIFAAPIYYLTFPAPMKSFLDRTQKYFFHRFSNNKKRKSYLIVTSGHDDIFSVKLMKKQIEGLCYLIGVKFVNLIWLKNTDKLQISDL